MSRIDFVTGAPEKYAHLVDALAKVPEDLNAVTAGKSVGALKRLDGDAWSAHRVLAHMASYAEFQDTFIHQVATMTDPAPIAHDEMASGEALMTRDPLALIADVQATIGRTLDLLSGTPDAGWGRPGRTRGGRRSLRQIVEAHILHMNEHIAQVREALEVKARV